MFCEHRIVQNLIYCSIIMLLERINKITVFNTEVLISVFDKVIELEFPTKYHILAGSGGQCLDCNLTDALRHS